MKRCYLTILLFLFTSFPFANAQNVCIEPKDISGPNNFNKWLPKDGDTVTFLVTISGASSSGSIVLNLTNVSNWPGTCMNKGSGNDPDLYFTLNDQSKEAYADVAYARSGQMLNAGLPSLPPGHTRNQFNGKKLTWTITDKGATATLSWVSAAYLPTGFTIPVTVRCRDYAAFATLEANFNGKATINIPKDDNGDYIADAWKDGLQMPYADDETGPIGPLNTVENNTEIGDGLVVFEEYRGAFVGGTHTRFDPEKKDVFIHSPYPEGIGDAINLQLSVFSLHNILKKGETGRVGGIGSLRIVNYNDLGTPTDYGASTPWRVMSKEAIWVTEITGSDSAHGSASLETLNIYIHKTNIDNLAKSVVKRPNKRGIPWTTESDAKTAILKRVLGHEIGHTLGLDHPWEVGVNGSVPTPDKLPKSVTLNSTTNGWIGLHAFDNDGSPSR